MIYTGHSRKVAYTLCASNNGKFDRYSFKKSILNVFPLRRGLSSSPVRTALSGVEIADPIPTLNARDSFLPSPLNAACSARLTNNQLASEQHISRWQIRVRDTIEHHGQRDSSDVSARLMLSCQWHGQQACVLHVIDSHDPNIVWYSLTNRNQRLHELASGKVVGTEKCVGTLF